MSNHRRDAHEQVRAAGQTAASRKCQHAYSASLQRPLLEDQGPYKSVPHNCATRPPPVSFRSERVEAHPPVASATQNKCQKTDSAKSTMTQCVLSDEFMATYNYGHVCLC